MKPPLEIGVGVPVQVPTALLLALISANTPGKAEPDTPGTWGPATRMETQRELQALAWLNPSCPGPVKEWTLRKEVPLSPGCSAFRVKQHNSWQSSQLPRLAIQDEGRG